MGASLIKDGRAQSNRPILIKVPKFLKNEKEYIGNPKGGLKICISIYNEIKVFCRANTSKLSTVSTFVVSRQCHKGKLRFPLGK